MVLVYKNNEEIRDLFYYVFLIEVNAEQDADPGFALVDPAMAVLIDEEVGAERQAEVETFGVIDTGKAAV